MSSLPTKTKVHLIPSLFSIQRLDVLPAVYKASPSAYIMITSVHHYEMNLFKIDPAEKIVQTQFCTQEVNVIVVSKQLLCDLCVCVCVCQRVHSALQVPSRCWVTSINGGTCCLPT